MRGRHQQREREEEERELTSRRRENRERGREKTKKRKLRKDIHIYTCFPGGAKVGPSGPWPEGVTGGVAGQKTMENITF